MTDRTAQARIGELSGQKRRLLQQLLAEEDQPAQVRPYQGRDGRWPVTSGQRRTFFDHDADVTASLWNMTLAGRVHGPLDPQAYLRAVGRVMDRHNVLRSRFERRDGDVWQVLPTEYDVPVALDDIRGLTPAERDAVVERAWQREQQRPFDLGQGAPLRGRLIRLAEQEHALFLTVHHIVLDGWSANILIHQLDEYYIAERDGSALPSPASALQFSDYARWQREWLRSADRLHTSGFWRDELAGAPSHLAFPSALIRPTRPGFDRGYLPLELPAAVSEAARRLAASYRTTLYTVLVTAFGLLLARVCDVAELVVAVPLSSRPQRELEELVGLFANLVPLRLPVIGRSTFEELLREATARVRRSLAHPDLPIEDLIAERPIETPGGYAPLSQVIFALYNYPRAQSILDGVEVSSMDREPSRALEIYAPTSTRPDVCVRIGDTVGTAELSGVVEYNRLALDEDLMERLFAAYRTLVAQVVAEPTRPLGPDSGGDRDGGWAL